MIWGIMKLERGGLKEASSGGFGFEESECSEYEGCERGECVGRVLSRSAFQKFLSRPEGHG